MIGEDGRAPRLPTTRGGRAPSPPESPDAGAFSAGIALALVYPWVRRHAASQSRATRAEGTPMKKRKPSIQSLETVSIDEARAYLEQAGGDELDAANAIAWDRNRLDGSIAPPDDAEVHHALFLLCRALGKSATSFDDMRVELRRRAAA
jgi:hypothetical protein